MATPTQYNNILVIKVLFSTEMNSANLVRGIKNVRFGCSSIASFRLFFSRCFSENINIAILDFPETLVKCLKMVFCIAVMFELTILLQPRKWIIRICC